MNEICLSCRKHTKCGRAEHETIGCGYYVPMTNEEWFKQANTEQLADVIADFYLLGFTHGHNKMDITSRTKWVEWLKQPHTKE